MQDEFFDADATKRVANRALVSALLAFLGGSIAAVLPFSPIFVLPFLVIAVLVGISAVRTLNHHEAHVIGGIRHLGIVAAVLGILAGLVGIALRVYVLVHG
jgi:hypothetical protein